MSFLDSDRLSIVTLFRRFWKQVTLTWALTLVEMVAIAAMPLVIGWSIDGLLKGDWRRTARCGSNWAKPRRIVAVTARFRSPMPEC